LMIDMMLTNQKLSDRALRLLADASGASVSAAEHALRTAGHDMRVALVMLKRRIGPAEARRRLQMTKGDLRKALGQ
jgi:N-acetylmuramic acid 6-phosphate etherase